MRFVVVADSHIRFPDDDVATYPSNALMVARNEHVVALCNQIDAEFVIHLGDIVHPVPVEESHEPAVQLATSVYESLRHPIHFVPGNHDIGDKPDSLVAVPPVADEFYDVFERYWGPAYRSFDAGECHFVLVDTPVLNSGLEREAEQRAWLEADLVAAHRAGKRIFLFTHYPPFIRDRDEFEHYDNLGEPARTWLLDLLTAHQVEAVFSGHVHNFLYSRHGETDLYVLPATGFVRPDYSELAAIGPEREGGRDDPAKLGFFVVDVDAHGHAIRPIRTHGAIGAESPAPIPLDAALGASWRSPVGVTLRHGWSDVTGFPTAGLDEFNRKLVRNDATLAALWEARIEHVRIPMSDAVTAEGRQRLHDLIGRGMVFTVRSGGVPAARTVEAVAALEAGAVLWEIAVPPSRFAATVHAVSQDQAGLPLALAPIVPVGSPHAGVHHFVAAGFDPAGDPLLDEWLAVDADGGFFGLVFRVGPNQAPDDSVAAAADIAAANGKLAIVTIDLPRGTESVPFTDDEAVADSVAAAAAAAIRHPEAVVFVDGFMDHDRSYYPHHGLIDRRANPRPALYRLIEAATGGG